jgi:hypothetical protein
MGDKIVPSLPEEESFLNNKEQETNWEDYNCNHVVDHRDSLIKTRITLTKLNARNGTITEGSR